MTAFTPVLQSFTMYRGARTKAGSGGVPLDAIILAAGSPAVSSYDVSVTGGTASHWQGTGTGLSNTTSVQSPTPTTAGDTANLNGGVGGTTYTFTVTAYGSDATSATTTITCVTRGANTFTIGTPADLSTTLKNATGSDARANLSGCTIEVASGSKANFPYDTATTMSGFNAAPSTTTYGTPYSPALVLTSENTTGTHTSVAANSWSTVGRFRFLGCNGLIVEKLNFESYVVQTVSPATPNDPLHAGLDNNTGVVSQGTGVILIDGNTTFGYSSDIEMRLIHVGGPATENSPGNWTTGINPLGSQGANNTDYTKAVARLNLHDLTVERVKDGLLLYNLDDCDIGPNVTVNRFCSNGVFAGGNFQRDLRFTDLKVTRPFYNPWDPADHRDFFQIGSGTVDRDWVRVTAKRIQLLTLDGDSGSQGPFFNDVGATGVVFNGGQPLTGFKFVDSGINGMLCDGPVGRGGVTVDVGTGWVFENFTFVRGKGVNTVLRTAPAASAGTYTYAGQPASQYGDGLFAANLQGPTGGKAGPTGIARRGTVHNTANVDAGFTLDPTIKVMGNTGLTTTGQNETARVTFYSAFYQDPGNDDPIIGLRPILNGPLKNADGTYSSALFPDGTWNDGSVYGGGIPAGGDARRGFLRRFKIKG